MTSGRVLSGTAASDGIAIGPAHLLVPPVIVVERQISMDLVPAEVARLVGAVTATDEQLALLSAGLESEHLHEGHLLLEAHRMMLRDDQIVGAARRLIESDEIAAESAVRRVIDAIAATFGRMEDPYLRERGADIEAIGDRLLRTLLGLPEVLAKHVTAPGTIGVGSILSPIDALHLPRSGMVGFAAERGGKTSHASIILRALEIPPARPVHGHGRGLVCYARASEGKERRVGRTVVIRPTFVRPTAPMFVPTCDMRTFVAISPKPIQSR